jgi:hypothetical protein
VGPKAGVVAISSDLSFVAAGEAGAVLVSANSLEGPAKLPALTLRLPESGQLDQNSARW